MDTLQSTSDLLRDPRRSAGRHSSCFSLDEAVEPESSSKPCSCGPLPASCPRRQEGGLPVLSHKMPGPLAEFSRGSSSKGLGTGEQGGFSAVGWDRPQGQTARCPESPVGWRGPLARASQLPLVRAREWCLPPASLRVERMEPHESQMRQASSFISQKSFRRTRTSAE